jgi:hypothetical protein
MNATSKTTYLPANQKTTFILSSSDRWKPNCSDNFSDNYNENYQTIQFSYNFNQKYCQPLLEDTPPSAASLNTSRRIGGCTLVYLYTKILSTRNTSVRLSVCHVPICSDFGVSLPKCRGHRSNILHSTYLKTAL